MEKKSCMMNPYVEQMEKFGRSLEHLADTFFRMEERKGQFYLRRGGRNVFQGI